VRPAPIRIEPTFSARLWGARSLAPIYPEKSNLAEPLGEAWLTDVDCKIASPPFEGKMLGEAWREMPAEWRGTRLASCTNFPLLVKFIFPKEKLSIQVHPDDAYAQTHERAAGGRGKTEMWHVVSAEPAAQLLLGLKPGSDKAKFLAALASHTVEDLFVVHAVHAGDTFFVPAGTPHTIGANMIVCEVQEYSDLTYRVYDYDRVDARGQRRELHLEKALEVTRFGESRGGRVASLPFASSGSVKKTLLAACRYFATERWEFRTTVQTETSTDSFEIFVVLEGAGSIHWQGAPLTYSRGQCWLLPASLGRFSLQPEQSTSLIKTYVPDLADLCSNLRKAGVGDTQLAQAVFS
jgi:mannose-6-phosphate isomerase